MFKIICWYNKGYYDKNKVEHIDIRCSNCGKQNVLSMDNTNTKYKDITTLFVLNTVSHHIGMSRIIKANKQLEYYTEKNNSDWITCGPWYNTSICEKLDGKCFEDFITIARTDRYNIMCSIDSHENKNPSEHDDGISGGGYQIPLNSTPESLVSPSETINFIGCWLKQL